mgnify:CR=1 FL=1
MGFKRILVAIDFSSLSQTIFDTAMELAIAHQSELLLIHCISADVMMTPPPFSGELGLSPHLVNQAYQAEYMQLERQTQQTQEWLAQYQAIAAAAGVKAEILYQVAEPGSTLCQMAQSWQADLVVMGRRGRRGLTEALLGSVSNYVLHHAPCGVLVVQGGNHPEAAQAHTTKTNHVATP